MAIVPVNGNLMRGMGFFAAPSSGLQKPAFQGGEGAAQNLPGLHPGWMRQIIDKPTPRKSMQPLSGCIGTFWDAKLHKIVKINLGWVLARPVPRYMPEDEPRNLLAWASDENPFWDNDYSANDSAGEKVRVLCNTRTKCNGLPK